MECISLDRRGLFHEVRSALARAIHRRSLFRTLALSEPSHRGPSYCVTVLVQMRAVSSAIFGDGVCFTVTEKLHLIGCKRDVTWEVAAGNLTGCGDFIDDFHFISFSMQVVTLCREHGLYNALIYLFNRSLDDFRSALEDLLTVADQASNPSQTQLIGKREHQPPVDNVYSRGECMPRGYKPWSSLPHSEAS